jgi:hypothetical protein
MKTELGNSTGNIHGANCTNDYYMISMARLSKYVIKASVVDCILTTALYLSIPVFQISGRTVIGLRSQDSLTTQSLRADIGQGYTATILQSKWTAMCK